MAPAHPGTINVDHGEDLVAVARRLAEEGTQWICAVGSVRGIELVTLDERTRFFEGPLALLSCSGPAGGPLMAVLAGAEPGEHGHGIFGGRIARALSAGVTLIAVGQPPRIPQGHVDPEENQPLPESTEPKSVPDGEEESDELLRYGDRVEHPVFGLCEVMVVRGDRIKIRDLHELGRVREIHLSVFKVLAPEIREDKRVFKLVKR